MAKTRCGIAQYLHLRCVALCGLPALVLVGAVLVQQAWQLWPTLCCETVTLEPAPGVSKAGRCPRVGEDIPADLTTYGYTILRGAVDANTSRSLHEYWKTLPWSDYFMPGYKHPIDGEAAGIFEAAPSLWPMFQALVKHIQAKTNITVAEAAVPFEDTWKAVEFVSADEADPEHTVQHIWHQDSDAYYISQKSYDYLNMYLIVEKSAPAEAGISVQSMEYLQERSPKSFSKLLDTSSTNWMSSPEMLRFAAPKMQGDGSVLFFKGKDDGAAATLKNQKREVVRSHMFHDQYWIQEFSIDDVSCTPELVAGDLLIMRGDTPHRTQFPMKGRRLALSVRIAKFKFSLEDMLTGGMVKYARMVMNPSMYVFMILKDIYYKDHVLLDAKVFRQDLEASMEMKMKFLWYSLRIWWGYYYRVLLSLVRCPTGWLLGEPICPLAYF